MLPHNACIHDPPCGTYALYRAGGNTFSNNKDCYQTRSGAFRIARRTLCMCTSDETREETEAC